MMWRSTLSMYINISLYGYNVAYSTTISEVANIFSSVRGCTLLSRLTMWSQSKYSYPIVAENSAQKGPSCPAGSNPEPFWCELTLHHGPKQKVKAAFLKKIFFYEFSFYRAHSYSWILCMATSSMWREEGWMWMNWDPLWECWLSTSRYIHYFSSLIFSFYSWQDKGSYIELGN